MAKLDKSQIKHIAYLSRLELKNEEIDLYGDQLSSVLEYFEKLNKVDTDNVEPMSNITGLSNVMRNDQKEESNLTHKDLEKNAPEFKDGNFVVPGVFE